MDFLILAGLIVVLLVRGAILRNRLSRMELRIAELSDRLDAQSRFVAEVRRESQPLPAVTPVAPPPPSVRPVQPAPSPAPEPLDLPAVKPPAVILPPHPVMPMPASRPAPARREWEAILGGSWLNKIGVFVLVVGLALLLRYSFTQLGPLGRVSICLAASSALLAAGVFIESREPYRVFARGLLGGGWAGLYVTVYAMHAIDSARVVDSPVAGALLLLAVAAGMIVHALRFRSQTVTGLAYFVAFATLAITDVTSLPFLALVPLAASLLVVAHRFVWNRMALFGLIATYAVVIARGNSDAPLWQAQVVFVVYWLLFETFDVLHPEAWLLPLNAAGFLGLSVLKWQSAAPGGLWIVLAFSAAAYIVSALARIRSGKWHGAATLTAALAAGAVFLKLDPQWIASALVVEAQLFYLAGLRLRSPYLRWLGTALFGVEAVRLLGVDVWLSPASRWAPVALFDATVFYVNRALCSADRFFGFAAAGMLALVIGEQLQEPYRSVAWQSLAAVTFAFGWWKRLFDFRLQGYLLLALGLFGTALEARELPLVVAALVSYAAVWCALRSGDDRLAPTERENVRSAGAAATLAALMTLAWRLAPAEYLAVVWMAIALPVLELGLRNLPGEFRRMSYGTAAAGAFMLWSLNVVSLKTTGPLSLRLIPAWGAVLAYVISARAKREERGIVLVASSTVGLTFGFAALWGLLPAPWVAASWSASALALLLAARYTRLHVFEWQSCAAAALAGFVTLVNLPDLSAGVWPARTAIACFYAAQLLSRRPVHRLCFSLMGTALLTLLLYYRVTGSMLTMACGIEGVILLASGFPLRDRVLRLSGLVLLFACILKLFGWDLRHLDTLPRIFSFIVLGVILLAVSWVYTRFRQRVAKFL